MRVCLVSYEFPPYGGGEASYTHALATAFSRRGHDVTVMVPKTRNPPNAESGDFHVLAIETAGPIRGARFLSGAERALDSVASTEKPDIVHVTFDYPTFLFHVRRRGIPCVATVHHLHLVEALSMSASGGGGLRRGLPLFLRASILTSLEGRLLRQCDTALAVSRFTASTVERYLGIDPRRLRVVMNGIDPTPFERGDGEAFRTMFPGVKEKAVLYVGRLSQTKGIDLLVEAFARIKKENPESSLVLVGSGDPKFVRKLMLRAASLGISNDVVFTGRIPGSLLPHAYAASSLTVLPSHMEGFGLSVLESMASARPAVATRVGGVPEILVDGKTGILVPPGDAGGLASAILSLLEDAELSRKMGRAGRELAMDRFTLERMAEGTMAVYEETVRHATEVRMSHGDDVRIS